MIVLNIYLRMVTTSHTGNTTIKKDRCIVVANFLAEAWYDPLENEITKVELIGLEKALKFYWDSGVC